MAVSRDVTFAQDGGSANVKVHPYIVALVRWCVSCLWSSATVLLHRLTVAPLPHIAAAKASKRRPAGKDHLDPNPRVECVVLHQPAVHNLDVIFVHGLYGSLGNTWRQGEWTSKYNVTPDKVLLRQSSTTQNPCHCHTRDIKPISTNQDIVCSFNNENKNNNIDNSNNNDNFTNIDDNFYDNISDNIRKIIPNEEVFITEKFYNNTLLDQVEIVDNYENQAKFVSELFKKNCDIECDAEKINNNKQKLFNNEQKLFNNDEKLNNNEQLCSCEQEKYINNCKCKVNDERCEVGCGCTCDDCYSHCWPRDWIKVDYPGARVISINYTSDPHLWRPLWIKENKRLRLHERAEQMMEQLLGLGVGKLPVVWVGHSKGGLFIKQIYCEAYEAHLKIKKIKQENRKEEQNMTEYKIDNEMNNIKDNNITENDNSNNIGKVNNNANRNNNNKKISNNDVIRNNNEVIGNNNVELNQSECLKEVKDVSYGRGNLKNPENVRKDYEERNLSQSSECIEDLNKKAMLWSNSAGFMFYSVPHRGSPLADIKTPITARSVELLEISKDCALVLSLQDRWLRATATSRPQVRSLVETRRTLMSVLWLRIVSPDSADPGIGALCGVSVDHREICKPSSRHCLLYTELASLIRVALNKCRCQQYYV